MSDKLGESEEMVLVRVKSASHPSCEDVEFSCNPKLTSVRQVKEKIRILYSFHPDVADQRLIYAGHLLDDMQLLTDVFGLSGTSFTSQSYQHTGPYTIHLACTSKSYIGSSQRTSRNENSAETGSQGSVFTSQIPNPMMHDPRHVNHPNPFEINGNSGIPPEFYALHQLYVEQMTAYMRSWNLAYGIAGGGSNQPGMGPVPNIPIPNINNLVNNQNPGPVPAPAAPPQNDRPRQGVAANFAGIGGLIGGPAAGNDDEENQRDFLDWAYTLSRVFLILGVVYFYSNFTRFLLVVIFTLTIALFQRRPLLNQQHQDARNQANDRQGNNNNNNPAPDQNRNEPVRPNARADANDQRDPAHAENNENGNSDAAPPANSPDVAGQAAEANVAAGAGAGQHRLAYYRDVTWTFLTTFFTSLIPEMPQHN